MQVGVTKELVNDALAISDAWSSELDLRDLIEAELRASGVLNLRVDVVAVGKAAREMASAARDVLTEHVQRQLVIVDEGPAISLDVDVEFVIGEHPRPGLGSLMAGERLVEFLEGSKNAECTIFLISGGASSLCALPQSPVDLDDLGELFAAVLESGADITTLNQLACGEFADRRGRDTSPCPDLALDRPHHGRQRRVGGALGGVGLDVRLHAAAS